MRLTTLVEYTVFVAIMGNFVCTCGRLGHFLRDAPINQPEDNEHNLEVPNDDSNDFYPSEANQDGPAEEHQDVGASLTNGNSLYNMTEEEERKWRMEMIRRQFLNLIPDLAPPNATFPELPSPLVSRNIHGDVVPRDEPPEPPVSQVVFFAEPAPARAPRKSIAIFFDLNSEYTLAHIDNVELWLYKGRSPDHSNHTLIISQLHSHHKHGKQTVLASERVGIEPGWVSFKDVTLTNKIRRWAFAAAFKTNTLSTAGHLMITCPTCEGNFPSIATEGDKKPLLVVNFKRIKKRVKRQSQWCGNNQNSCCKKAFQFNFREANLHGIVEPSTYQPNYCQGSCVVRDFPETVVMADSPYVSVIMQSKAFQERNKEPCCAPDKLSPMTVLYFDRNQRLIRRKIEKMVVDSCGCH